MENYFLYIFVDLTKPGQYHYQDIIDYSFLYEPFYVGKGSGRREKWHLYSINNRKHHNKLLQNKIIKIDGRFDILKISCVSESSAFLLEKIFIDSIGKKIDKKGTLTNIKDGGTGGSKHHESTIKKMIKNHKGRTGTKASEETKKRIDKISIIIDGVTYKSLRQAKIATGLGYYRLYRILGESCV